MTDDPRIEAVQRAIACAAQADASRGARASLFVAAIRRALADLDRKAAAR